MINNILEKWKSKKYPEYIIKPINSMDDVKLIEHDMLNVLSNANGIIILTQFHRLGETENIIAKFIKLGLREKARGNIKVKTIKKGDKIDVIYIVLEKIGKLWL